jgi:uncharacterized protein YbjT (DUF2867 family)
MTNHDKTILVAGATGKQGGAVATRLLADGWNVRALTRDPQRPAAARLAEAGAELATADLDDLESLARAAQGVYGIFSVHAGTFEGSPYFEDQTHEQRSAANIAKAAGEAGATLVVHSSAIGVGTDMEEKLPMLAAKCAAEAAIRAGSVPVTVLRPGSFMENYFAAMRGLRDGTLVTPLWETTREPLVATADIAAFAAAAFAQPEEYKGLSFELAGDLLTQRQIADAIGAAANREVPYVTVPIEAMREISLDMANGLEAVNRNTFDIDIAALRVRHPGLLTFSQWLTGPGAAALSAHFSQLDSPR